MQTLSLGLLDAEALGVLATGPGLRSLRGLRFWPKDITPDDQAALKAAIPSLDFLEI